MIYIVGKFAIAKSEVFEHVELFYSQWQKNLDQLAGIERCKYQQQRIQIDDTREKPESHTPHIHPCSNTKWESLETSEGGVFSKDFKIALLIDSQLYCQVVCLGAGCLVKQPSRCWHDILMVPKGPHGISPKFPSQEFSFPLQGHFPPQKYGILGTKRKTNMPRKKWQFLRKSLWYLFLHSETNPLTRNNWSQNNSTTRKWIKSLLTPPKLWEQKLQMLGLRNEKKHMALQGNKKYPTNQKGNSSS